MKRFCTECQKQVDASARNCPGCGAAITAAATSPEKGTAWIIFAFAGGLLIAALAYLFTQHRNGDAPQTTAKQAVSATDSTGVSAVDAPAVEQKVESTPSRHNQSIHLSGYWTIYASLPDDDYSQGSSILDTAQGCGVDVWLASTNRYTGLTPYLIIVVGAPFQNRADATDQLKIAERCGIEGYAKFASYAH